ncbi:hypothetical protein ECANGB1_473 [Enterospora canceri]|uniref:Uncharacterized protein n=1 Tax=Enterospora canceri TaxID=1081671 RepID=A0A1Y1S7X3_9MICR|nr:hypothetical protein ECANGB1_473 [Enterospora canceri]
MSIKHNLIQSLEKFTEHTVKETGLLFGCWQAAYEGVSTEAERVFSIGCLVLSVAFLLNLFCIGLRFKRVNAAIIMGLVLYNLHSSIAAFVDEKANGVRGGDFKEAYDPGQFYVKTIQSVLGEEGIFKGNERISDAVRQKMKKKKKKKAEKKEEEGGRRELFIFLGYVAVSMVAMWLVESLVPLVLLLLVAAGARALYVMHFSDQEAGAYLILGLTILVSFVLFYFVSFLVDAAVAALFGFIGAFYGMCLAAILANQKDYLNEMWINTVEYTENEMEYPEEYTKWLIVLVALWFVGFGLNMFTRVKKGKI